MTVKFDMADECRAEIFYQLFAQLFLKNAEFFNAILVVLVVVLSTMAD